MNAPRLIVGLGNPTDQHAHDRHNAGFWFIDALLRHYPGQMRPDAKFLGDVGEVRIGTQVVRLLKPMTYMNRSGQSVGALARFYRLEPADILIAYDELDLMPGSARLKLGGSSTHNGLRDITAHLGTPRYWRLRLGIGQATTHQALDRADDVAGVGQQRLLGGVAHHGRSVGAVMHDRRQQLPALLVRQRIGHARTADGHQRVGGSQIDTDGIPALVRIRTHARLGNLQQRHRKCREKNIG